VRESGGVGRRVQQGGVRERRVVYESSVGDEFCHNNGVRGPILRFDEPLEISLYWRNKWATLAWIILA
jgi:hypothetical protein